ncbi:hypothetical protein E2C01_014674 [Portunus trituberculatus]|uniref:Uncharacterized protein n=1 Tax=Portunus trituberculatus TaxID=210409 RepID=A0A5B7DJH4_PORTR|nr:hypothetical protein [Portunus trituberculatus]
MCSLWPPKHGLSLFRCAANHPLFVSTILLCLRASPQYRPVFSGVNTYVLGTVRDTCGWTVRYQYSLVIGLGVVPSC